MPNLKEDFIDCLKVLRLPPAIKRRVNNCINAIRKVPIPQSNYLEILGFIELLLEEIPEVTKVASNNQRLKNLGLHCLEKKLQPNNNLRSNLKRKSNE